MHPAPAFFEQHEIRRVYDEAAGIWWFSVVDILQVLLQQPDYQGARNYWKVLKHRLAKEGSESVTNCNRLKLTASDGKQYLTDVATAETLLRLVQSIPSPKAEPIKLWLAKVGHERMQELADPALAELSTRQVAERMNATGMPENEVAAKTGGGFAREAREKMESLTGQPVVTPEIALPSKTRKALKATKPVNRTEDDEPS